jgi:type IV secretory pathway protease TraF
MNETPEASPPAFPSAEPAEASGPTEVAPGRSLRFCQRRLPKLSVELSGTLAEASWHAPHGTWRVAVAEESMAPALAPGDWLLLDPTSHRWPRRGSIVIFHEPGSGILAIKRVAAGPGDRVRISAGLLRLGPDDAWLLGDNAAVSLDSRRYGPVSADALVGRAWLRYGPMSKIGLLRRADGPIGQSGTPVVGTSSPPGSRDQLRYTDGGGAMRNIPRL